MPLPHTHLPGKVAGLVATLVLLLAPGLSARRQVDRSPSDTAWLKGDAPFPVKLQRLVVELERREQAGSLRSSATMPDRISDASSRADAWLTDHPEDVSVLVLAARIGRLRQSIEPTIITRDDPLTLDRFLSPYRTLARYLDHALRLAPDDPAAAYWKARLLGMGVAARQTIYGFEPPPDSEASVLRLLADSTIYYATRAVTLAPEEVSYREALAIYLIDQARDSEAAVVMLPAMGGRHPMTLLMNDWQQLPAPPFATPWPAQREIFIERAHNQGMDFPQLRLQAYVWAGPVAPLLPWWQQTWPGLKLFEMEHDVEEGGELRMLSQFLRRKGSALEPSRKKKDVEKADEKGTGGFLVMAIEMIHPVADLPGLPIPPSDTLTLLVLMNFHEVR